MNKIDWLYSSQQVCIWFINPCLLYLKCVWHTFLFCLFKIFLEYLQTNIYNWYFVPDTDTQSVVYNWELQHQDDNIESVKMIMKECWAFVRKPSADLVIGLFLAANPGASKKQNCFYLLLLLTLRMFKQRTKGFLCFLHLIKKYMVP